MTQQRDAIITRVTPEDLFDALRAAWRALLGEDAPRSALVLLTAQWALETAWGAACHAFNLGNAKAQPGGPTDWCYFACDERMSPAQATHAIALDPARAHLESQTPGPDGKMPVWFDPPHPISCFQAFASLADGALTWLKLQHGRFGGAWPALLSGNARLFATALHDEGYFTAPVDRYATTLAGVQSMLDGKLPDFQAADPGDTVHDTDRSSQPPTPVPPSA